MPTELSLAIRLARVVSGKSQWDIAKHFGLHPIVVNQMEHGKREIDTKLAREMMKEFRAGAPKNSHFASLVLTEAEKIINCAGNA
jgi:hypothetical protein